MRRHADRPSEVLEGTGAPRGPVPDVTMSERKGIGGRIDFVIFFWDPLEPHPHDVDVKALVRIAVVYNVPIACNRSSADFMLSSPLMSGPYRRMAYLLNEPDAPA